FSTAAAAAQALEDLAPRSRWNTPIRCKDGIERGDPRSERVKKLLDLSSRVSSWLGIVPAAYVGSYTGVLLSATNVPLWAGNKYFLGPLFFTSALGAGLAGTRLAAGMLGEASEAPEEGLERAEGVRAGAGLALTAPSVGSL